MTTPTQPGWYDDPDNSNAQRYWDGQDWTPHRQRKSAAPTAQPHTQAQAPIAPPPPPPPNLPLPPTAADPLPPPPAQAQPSAAPRGKFQVSKVALSLAGLALVLAIAALVASRVKFGSFVWGIVVVAAIAVIAAFFTLRSNRTVARKAMVVAAIAVVVAAAIPASLKVVYPVYNHFLPQKSAQASRGGTAGPGSGPEAPSGPGSAPEGPGPGAPSSGSTGGGAKSGIVAVSTGTSSLDFGYFDPSTGKYTHISSFTQGGSATSDVLQISPDLSRYATSKADTSTGGSYQAPIRVGWIDSSGTFTAVSPAPPPASDFQQSQPPRYTSPMFDGAGNFYYWSTQDGKNHLYKVPAGSTSNPQEVTPTPEFGGNPYRNFDGTLHFGCPLLAGKWLGPDSRMFVSDMGDPTTSVRDNAVVKASVTTTSNGCPWIDQINRQGLTKVFDLGIQPVDQPIASPDHTRIAFYNSNTPGGLYVVTIGGDSKPTRIATKEQLTQFGNLKLIGWS